MSEIDFENINAELNADHEASAEIAKQVISQSIDLSSFVDVATDFEIESRETASQALTLSLQARKMRQALDKKRGEVVRPAYQFQKNVNAYAKKFEIQLQEIEDALSEKIREWFKGQKGDNLSDLMNQKIEVPDGSVSQKMHWVFEIESPSEVPDKYLSVDPKKVEAAVKAGVREIPGIKIYETIQIAMKVKN